MGLKVKQQALVNWNPLILVSIIAKENTNDGMNIVATPSSDKKKDWSQSFDFHWTAHSRPGTISQW